MQKSTVYLLALLLLVAAEAHPQDLVISEFVAINGDTLLDEDGDASDWLEVHNLGIFDVDLGGWSVTDRADDLRKWTFPSLTLEAGGFLVVFASGKNRTSAESELHTNFSLRGEGEYLALVRPDGSIAHEFHPAFPSQVENVSYGLEGGLETLLQVGATADYLVPTDDSLGLGWTSGGFLPDAGWESGSTGLGYHQVPVDPTELAPLSYWSLDGHLGDLVSVNDGSFEGGSTPNFVEGFDGTAEGAVEFDGINDYIDLDTASGLPVYNQPAYTIAMWVKGWPQPDNRVYSEGSSSNNDPLLTIGTDSSGGTGKLDIFIRTDTGSIILSHRLSEGIVLDGSWHHIAWVDENGSARLYIDGSQDSQEFNYPKQAMSLDISSIGGVLRESACCHFIGAIDGVAIWNRALTAPEVALLAPGEGSTYSSFVATDVGARLKDVNASIYTRLPFVVAEPGDVDSLRLKMRYDDGFIAFLNGVEVASRNAPAMASWNSTAQAEHAGTDAVVPETINLSASIGELVAGENVLAIHGLNLSAADEDFLILPELEAATALSTQLRYFVESTPGAPNEHGTIDFVADTKFSVDRGFFEEPFLVEITTATDGAEIRYTVDGSAPTETTGALYDGPIEINTTTVLRAVAFKDGFQPTNVDTHTYLFLDDVIRQPNDPPGYPSTWAGLRADYAMDPEITTDENSAHYEPTIKDDLLAIPTLSLVLDPDDWMGPTLGIYTHPLARGLAWERAGSAELILPDHLSEDGDGTDEGFQLNCGIRIQGGSSAREIEGKHSYRLLFKSIYGPSKLRYKWFKDSPLEEFDTIVLRCFSTDSWHFKDGGARYRRWDSQYIRDIWMKDAQLAMGHLSSHNTYVHLYVNGLYWGLYNPSERPDDSFQSLYQGDEKEDWDIMKDFNELFRGNRQSWNQFMSLANAGLSSQSAYQRIQGNNPDGTPNPLFDDLLDVDNLIDYMILHLYACAEDWPHHNWYAARSRTGNLGGWRFFVWDQEIVMDFVFRNRTGVNNANSPADVYDALRRNPEFLVRFGDRVQKHLFRDGALSVEKSQARWLARANEIDRAIVGESARWGDFREDVRDPSNSPATLYTRDEHWVVERDKVLNEYIPESNRLAIERFQGARLYPRVEPPIFSPHGGAISDGFSLGLSAPLGTVFYTLDGSDPRLEGGAVSASALMAGSNPPVSLLPSPPMAKILVPSGPAPGSAWKEPDFDDSAWDDATMGIGFERSSGYEDEFSTDVESLMYDINASIYIRIPFQVEDLSNFNSLFLNMKYDDGFVVYLNGNEVMGRNVPDPLQWDSRASRSHADQQAVVPETIDLTEQIGLLTIGENVLAIHGLNSGPTSTDFLIVPELLMSTATDDPKITLTETTMVRARAKLGEDWSALVEAAFFTTGPLSLRITEIMYNPPSTFGESAYDDEEFEYIELGNVSSEKLTLIGVRFSEGIEFDFTTSAITHLSPGDVALLVKNQKAFAERYGEGFPIAGEYEGSLDNAGENIRLEDPFGDVILQFEYQDTWYEDTDGDGLALEIVDAGAPPGTWGQQSSWRPSLGSPGFHDMLTLLGGLQVAGDANQDGALDVSDAIELLFFLFLGGPLELPCDGTSINDGGNLALLDLNSDEKVDLSDAVNTLSYLFASGPPPAIGTGCLRIEGCPDTCSP